MAMLREILFTLMILLLVGAKLLFWGIVAFFGAMTLAGFVYAWRWVTGGYQPAWNDNTIVAACIYSALLALFGVLGILKEKLKFVQEKWLALARGIR